MDARLIFRSQINSTRFDLLPLLSGERHADTPQRRQSVNRVIQRLADLHNAALQVLPHDGGQILRGSDRLSELNALNLGECRQDG